ncbi:MAG: T9SS type A sorting domain-containing protein [Bacteroidales bacterium]|nr:T9SS type A sorting domain-containing protein [Bacteroidales bacterium]
MLHINHTALWGIKTAGGNGFSVSAKIVPYSKRSVYADSLLVYYSIDNGKYNSIKMTSKGGYNYSATIPVQSAGSSVQYYIHAADRSGRSVNHPFIGSADPHEFTVKGGTGYELNNIADLAAKTQNCSTIVLSWTDSSTGEDGFRVRRKVSGGSYIDLKDVAANSASFTDKTAKANTSYTYMVLPFKGSTIKTSNSAYAKTGTCTGGDVINNITDLTSKTQNCTTVVLTWTDNSQGEDAFRVRRKVSGGKYQVLKDVAANSTSFTDNTAKANTSYTYMVRPYKGSTFKKSNLAYATTKECGTSTGEITINDIITDCNKAKKARNIINFTVKGSHNSVTSNYGIVINRGADNYIVRHVRLPFGKTYTYQLAAKNNGTTIASKTLKVTTVYSCPKSAEESIAPGKQSPALVIYPDPAENYLQIKGLEYGTNIKIYNITGTQVMNTQVQERIDISNLKPGIYMLISAGKSTRFIKK